MIKFKATAFFRITQSLKGLGILIEQLISKGTNDQAIDEKNARLTISEFDELLPLCKSMGLNLSVMLLEEMRSVAATAPAPGYTFLILAKELKELERRIRHEMSLPVFMVISPDKANYYEQIDLFGSQVSANFSTSVYDIEESGNCYASGRHTAYVFHLMRVLEKGLHAFARELNIIFPTPLELENWQKHY